MNMFRFGYFFLIEIALLSLAYANKLDTWKARNQVVKQVHEKIGLTWINGIIPYFLDNKSYDHIIALRLRMTMNELEGISCIRFKPIIGKPNLNTTWLHITNPSFERECMHLPRYDKSGEVTLVFGLDCLSEQQILHTLMHGIGFKDEVTHPQRDQYIRILWDNIQPGYHHLFRIQADDGSLKTLSEYDPMSVMQFHDRAFSLNGRATVAPLISGLIINPSDGLSQLDTMKLRMMFGQECKRRNVDDLLDMCKTVLHDELKQDKSTNPSKSNDIEMPPREQSVESNGNDTQITNNRQIEDIKSDIDNDENVSENEEDDVEDDKDVEF
ncbi:unnamed protein product, partial [Iphiclides podalirius]